MSIQEKTKHPDCEILRQIFMRHMGQGYKNYVTAALHVMLLGGLCPLVSDVMLVSDVSLS